MAERLTASSTLAATRAKAFAPFVATISHQGRTISWVARQLSATTGRHVEPRALWSYLNGRRRMPEEFAPHIRAILGVPVDIAYVELPRDVLFQTPRTPKPAKPKRPRGRPRKYPLPVEASLGVSPEAGEARAARGPPAA